MDVSYSHLSSAYTNNSYSKCAPDAIKLNRDNANGMGNGGVVSFIAIPF